MVVQLDKIKVFSCTKISYAKIGCSSRGKSVQLAFYSHVSDFNRAQGNMLNRERNTIKMSPVKAFPFTCHQNVELHKKHFHVGEAK